MRMEMPVVLLAMPSEDRKMTFKVLVLQGSCDSCPYRKRRGHSAGAEMEGRWRQIW